MKKKIVLVLLILPLLCSGQYMYKGFFYGQHKSTVKAEYKKNKKEYKNIDVGNGAGLKISSLYSFKYENEILTQIVFSSKAPDLIGLKYKQCIAYLNYMKLYFENIGYEVFYKNDFWNLPHNYSSANFKHGLYLVNKEKNLIVELEPSKIDLNSMSVDFVLYNIAITLSNFTWFKKKYNFYEAGEKLIFKPLDKELIEKAGF